MAHDKTPERNNLIFFYTLLTVATLGVLSFVFDSYFSAQSDDVFRHKVREQPALEVAEVKEAHRKELSSGPVPIERAMQQMAGQGRPSLVEPEPSDERAPLEGWGENRLPHTVPPALVPAVPESEDAEDEASEGDETEGEATEDGAAAGDADEGVAPEGNTSDTSPSTEADDAPKAPSPGAPAAPGSQE